MKLIIDIPNWLYNAIMEHHEPVYSQSLGDAVRDGTPLPKGHGKLKDVDELLKCAFVRNDDEGDIFVSQYYCIEKSDFNNLPTIIDAESDDN